MPEKIGARARACVAARPRDAGSVPGAVVVYGVVPTRVVRLATVRVGPDHPSAAIARATRQQVFQQLSLVDVLGPRHSPSDTVGAEGNPLDEVAAMALIKRRIAPVAIAVDGEILRELQGRHLSLTHVSPPSVKHLRW
ncbi:hypothetical protein HZA86_03070 [Candidatus Uhrbacteria bacterium]|nr:hypothetical protein [Candidatus Uhrbacteria bacterium]